MVTFLKALLKAKFVRWGHKCHTAHKSVFVVSRPDVKTQLLTQTLHGGKSNDWRRRANRWSSSVARCNKVTAAHVALKWQGCEETDENANTQRSRCLTSREQQGESCVKYSREMRRIWRPLHGDRFFFGMHIFSKQHLNERHKAIFQTSNFHGYGGDDEKWYSA